MSDHPGASRPDAARAASPLEDLSDLVGSLPQRLYPKRLLSALMYALTRVRFRPWKAWQIDWFTRRYGVDLGLAAIPDPDAYPDFNAFFTRALRADARPLEGDESVVVSPADGVLCDFGPIEDGRLLEAKGRRFTVERLLGGDPARSAPFRDGAFATVYLSPRDYHRVHMPRAGRLREMVYVPGKLYSVNLDTTRRIPGLFARNERVASLFDTDRGPLAVVMVGALFVGSIEQVWHGVVTPPRGDRVRVWCYDDRDESIELERGAELGRFNMGSTVIVLIGGETVDWEPRLRAGAPVEMGRALGRPTVRERSGA